MCNFILNSWSQRHWKDELFQRYGSVGAKVVWAHSFFVSAIRFALCDDEYANMDKEQRQQLLYDAGGSAPALSGMVELAFDNSDNRLPVRGNFIRSRISLTHLPIYRAGRQR